ncbi:hypothetical protein B0O79_2573 [Flavobacteriaceae bacterium MAR_2009_75]|nr:hypothetical protein B0O79_2573 [Flavobacteriaceae bacterium MAR_2009_75]
MNKHFAFFSILCFLLFTACKTDKKTNPNMAEESKISDSTEVTYGPSKGERFIQASIKAHGGQLYNNAHYGFTFRNKYFTFKNSDGKFTYTMEETKEDVKIKNILSNNKLTQTQNGNLVKLTEKDSIKYTEAVNSVIYFATLPHKLNDNSVISEHLGQTTIKGKSYEMVKVHFKQEGGGVDFEDVFLYWFNDETNIMDYLAYKYKTNDGGVRFRSAYNPRTIDGIRFQDYINYKAEIGTPMQDLPKLYENGSLKALSRIETDDVVNLNK